MHKAAQAGSSGHSLNPTAQLTTGFGWFMSSLAGVSYLLALWTLVSPVTLTDKAGWPEAVLVLAMAIATLAALARHLPGQNVILAAAVIGCIGGIAHGAGAATSIPFGPFHFTDRAGPRILGLVPWPMPAIWIIAILNSRGVARLILRPWRTRRTYGLWLIGLTATLTALFAVALDPYAAQVKGLWLWQPRTFPLTGHGMPLVNCLGWLVTALLILAFVTPALISKQPRPRESPPDFHPLALWLASLALYATGAIVHKLWPATVFCILTGALVTGLALRGAVAGRSQRG